MNSNGGSSFFGSDWLGAFLIIAILFGGGLGFSGRGYGPGPDVATKEFVQDSVNNQAVQTGIRDILLSSANNNYETAQLINGQTNALMQQQYTHQIENDQRFFALQQQVSQLGYQMDQCCCSIKTQMLQDKYDETVRELTKAQTEAINAQQSAYLLSVMGKWIANPAATTT